MESLRGMVSFVQTARSGSFVKAAEVLGVSSVAVSRNVARLEEKLKLRLFARTTRHLSLTAEGAALLAQCEAPLEQLDAAFRGSRDAAGEAEGVVRVTAVSPYVRAYLAPSLAAFHAQYPKVELDIECSEQATDLVAGRFDVGIRVGPMQDAAFVARPLGPLHLVLCAAPAFLARGPLPPAGELAHRHGLGLKRVGDSQAAPWRLQEGQRHEVLPVAGPLRCNDFMTLATACAAGLGVAQLPMVLALPMLRDCSLQMLWPERAPQGLHLFLHYPDRQLPARVRVFVDFVLQAHQAHPDLALTPLQFSAMAPRQTAPPASTPAGPAAATRARRRPAR
jgi:DNA-binding transcriptional LysR family regulator